MLLHSSDHLYAVFHPGSSDFLVITFGYNGMKADGENFWGKSLCVRAGYNAVGFVTREPTWFAPSHMAPAIADVLPSIAQFTRRMTYAGSMGGFAAMRYGKALGAGTALVYVPQFSLDPEIAGRFDPKFPEFFRPELHRGMEPDGPRDIPDTSYLLFDRSNPTDAGHAALFQATAPWIRAIGMPHTHHATSRVFVGVGSATRLIEAVLADDAVAVRRVAAESRRASPLRAFLTHRHALSRHPGWAAGIAARHGDRFDQQQKAEMYNHMSALIGRYSGAEAADPKASRILAAARAATAISADDPLARMREAGALATAGNLAGAIDLAQQVTAAAPRYAGAYHTLAGWLLVSGDFEGAAEAAARAADLEPDEAPFHERGAVAESRRGRPREAIAAARRAVSCDPRNPRRRDFLASLLQREGQWKEAAESLLKAISLDSGDIRRHKALFHVARKAQYHGVALRAAEAALALLPDDTEAQGMLSWARTHLAAAS